MCPLSVIPIEMIYEANDVICCFISLIKKLGEKFYAYKNAMKNITSVEHLYHVYLFKHFTIVIIGWSFSPDQG